MRGALGVAGAAVLGESLLGSWNPARASTRSVAVGAATAGNRTGIDHIVVVMLENRSFDHFLGWLPNADGIGVSADGKVVDEKRFGTFVYPDSTGARKAIYHQTALDGCAYGDQDHSYGGGRQQYDGGRMDGFLLDKSNDSYAASYYLADQRPFMSQLALNFTTCDRYHCSILGPTYPNRYFMHAGMTQALDNSSSTSTLPTIWDRFNQSGGPNAGYYFGDVPFLALWGTKYLDICSKYEQFLVDAASGRLPNLVYIDPRFEDEGDGTSNDDHPVADIRGGDTLLSEIYNALASGPHWERTVLVVNYDEWGGFFDHVAPHRVTPGVPIGASAGTDVDKDQVNGKVRLGFRVPCMVASPFTVGRPEDPRVAHGLYDHTSVLKMIEWNWGLKPLTQRDASTSRSDPGNLAAVLNLRHPASKAPALPDLSP
ncbi:MAG TPA: alkaline phosphatase family protein, partial [Acidimicrobiales bacterium]|nr:alkaline phosphatase family protein [Acidimicrobiales bacterium]